MKFIESGKPIERWVLLFYNRENLRFISFFLLGNWFIPSIFATLIKFSR